MIGQSISHYKIIEKLGEGGMGVVYKAEDTKLGRQVALKFLPPQLSASAQDKENLIREARTSSSLDHPNVCAIHSVEETPEGQMFIVMPFYDGATLHGKIAAGLLKPEEAVAIAISIAEGLAAAHAKGMVHRDIKSANIIVTNDGQTKIMDFGLARMDNRVQITKQGTLSGTIAYMSPEQARGETVDQRSDLWSLGIVLYEMLSGKVPFNSFYDQAVVYAILNEDPPRLEIAGTLAPALGEVLRKALSKEPQQRFQSAQEFIAALKQCSTEATRPSSGSSKRQKSIVVLPFDNISPEKENEYISDGLTEEIIANLSKIKTIKVISRTSAMHYKGTDKSLQQIAEELHVQYILEGSVRKHANNVRITAQLIDAAEDAHMWSEKYNGSVEQLFDIQEKVADEIVAALKLQLSDEEQDQLKKRSTENSEAYQLYLKGRFYWNKRNEVGVRKGLELFSQAIELDPTYARAYIGLADSYSILGFLNIVPPKEAFGTARGAVVKALEIDPNISEAHASLAYTNLYTWKWKESEEGFQKAIRLDPGYSTAHQWYGNLLCALNRLDEARREFGIGQQLDPLSLIISTGVAWSHHYSRMFEEAVKKFHKVLEMDANFPLANLWLARTYEQLGRLDDAIVIMERLMTFEETPNTLASFAGLLAKANQRERAMDLLDRAFAMGKTRYVSAYDVCEAYIALGEYDTAFDWLERSYNEGARGTALILVEPRLDPIRSDLRFKELVKKMELVS